MSEIGPKVTKARYDFHGGIHPPENKQLTRDRPIRDLPLMARYVLPLHMHIGASARPVVKVGERVGKGQVLAQATDFISATIHAPTSGTVVAIDDHLIPHPGGLRAPSILLESDGDDLWADMLEPWPDYQTHSPTALRSRLRESGVVGLGGAVFPTAAKLATGPAQVTTLVLNGAECEPYITCDDRLMRESPADIVAGARIALHMLGATQCLIGIEDNKPESLTAMRTAVAEDPRFAVVSVPTRYPAGGEKQLIRMLTGIEVPRGRRATEYGLLCLNVATVASVYQAVVHGLPVIDRIVTLTGGGVVQPDNFKVRIGTLMNDVLTAAGGYRAGVDRLIMGGPMMGFSLPDDTVPVVKATNCMLALRPEDRPEEPAPQPCIRCSLCAEACPADLLPQQLYWYARSRQFDRAVAYHLFDCIECGVCTAVCPSHIPLVDYYRFAKTEVWAQEREKSKATVARDRFEFRKERLERQKAEREAALNKKRQALEAKAAKAVQTPKPPGDTPAEPQTSTETAAGEAAYGEYRPGHAPIDTRLDSAVEAARARSKARRAALEAQRTEAPIPESDDESEKI
ncbi:MAG TPA: electron transport complex subunit RsxC [Halothiobacillus sp.]|nr:electron transport complex subunit RsxC [Halothiobacillus sp.]